MTYGLPDTYTARLQPQYFDDTLPDSASWQSDVYRLAVKLARKVGIKRLVDIGCGRGLKLAPFAHEFETLGIDYGANIEACLQYPEGEWLAVDLNTTPVAMENFRGSIAICADVIEHLPTPDALVVTLRNAAERAAYVLISTPDRDRVYKGKEQNGMPGNPYHVREWTNAELVTWLRGEGLPVVWVGWTISNDARPDQVYTSLVILSKHPLPMKLPITFEPTPEFRPRVKHNSSALKVWMSPTPSEAARDNTNSIHQIVLRMAQHLPDCGMELVEARREADVTAVHAGQGSDEPVDVAHYHGLYPTGMGMDSGGHFAINSHVIRNLKTARAITAPSEWIADVLRRDMHVNPHVVPWAVDTEEWTPGEQTHIYTLWNKARVDWVCDPAPMIQLAEKMPQALFLTTFGTGTPNIKTIGRQPYEAMKQYVRNAAVYLSTNVETWGVGTAEAMAAGVPVLAFRQPNTDQMVQHGVTGFLAESGDIDGLAEGLAYCLQHRKTLGANAREFIKQFTWDRVAQSFAAVYRDVLEPHKGVKVSIIIPCHNYAHYAGEAIESALSQQANFDFEIIVVLDRCSDNSAEVVARYEKVKALPADNGNLSATRNQGIEAASGEYVVCLDADDRIGSPHFLQTLADELDKDRTLGIAFTSLQVMDTEGVLGHIPNWPDGYDFTKQASHINQIPSLCMFRREAWRRAGGFRPFYRFVEDAEFWTTLLSIGYTAKHVTREPMFQYRLHSDSASRVHRTGEVPEPDWLEWHPWVNDKLPPFAAEGKPPRGSWPVRFYNKPDVTVIIPVGRGHEAMVKDALHSVEGQTYRFWECIVVNDSGHDLKLEDGYSWVKEIHTRAGIGAGAARNLGAKQANAPFLVFLDADDMLKPRFLELTLKAYRAHGRYAYTDWLTEEKQIKFEVHPTPEYSFQAVWERPSIHPVTTLIPRAWFEAVGGFDESMTAFEDVDFYMKMLTHGFCGVRVPEPLLIYHTQSGFRRTAGEKIKDEFKKLLTARYGKFMEGKTMCNCVDPPKGKQPVPPTVENVAEYRETYGEMVLAQWTAEDAPQGQVMFKGPATRVNYGRRAKGDTFYVWEKDITQSEGVFSRVQDYTTEAPQTVTPPPPVLAQTIAETPVIEAVSNGIETDASPVVEKQGWESEPYVELLNDDGTLNIRGKRIPTMVSDQLVEVNPAYLTPEIKQKPRGKPGRKPKAK
jgi:glycosyltransferase involved in cell wall biosynthesis